MASQSGIYAIYCKEESLIYIGSSSSIRFRFSRHKAELNKGEHVCLPLQKCWNRHRHAGFTFYVLENCCVHDCKRNEQMWITAAKMVEGLTVANKNISWSRSIGKIEGKPIQSRLLSLQMILKLESIAV